METLKTINFVIAVIFFGCYTYQFLYIPVPWLRKARPHGPAKDNRYAVLICARNEQRVIGDLIASLRGADVFAGSAVHFRPGGQLHRRHGHGGPGGRGQRV